MRVFEIEKVKEAVGAILESEFFGEMLLYKAVLYNAYRTEISGNVNRDFFDTEDMGQHSVEIEDGFVKWNTCKGTFFQAMRGKTLPLSFDISLIMPRQSIEAMVRGSGALINSNDITSVGLNIRYRRDSFVITSIVSKQGFNPDKSFDEYWDGVVAGFLNKLDT